MLPSNEKQTKRPSVDSPPPLVVMPMTHSTPPPPPVRKKRPHALWASPLLPSTFSLCTQSGLPYASAPNKHLFALPSSISLPASRHAVLWCSERGGDDHLLHHPSSLLLQEENGDRQGWVATSHALEVPIRCGSASGTIDEEEAKGEGSEPLHRMEHTSFSFTPLCVPEKESAGRTKGEGRVSSPLSLDPERRMGQEWRSTFATTTTTAAAATAIPSPTRQSSIPVPVDFQVRHFTSNALRVLLYLWYFLSFLSFLLLWVPDSRWMQYTLSGKTYGAFASLTSVAKSPRRAKEVAEHHHHLCSSWEEAAWRQSQTTTSFSTRPCQEEEEEEETREKYLFSSRATPRRSLSPSLGHPLWTSSLVWRMDISPSSFAYLVSETRQSGGREPFFFFSPGRRLHLHLPPSPLSFLQARGDEWGLHVKRIRFAVWRTRKKRRTKRKNEEEAAERVEITSSFMTTATRNATPLTSTRNATPLTSTRSVLPEETATILPPTRRQLWFPDVWLRCASSSSSSSEEKAKEEAEAEEANTRRMTSTAMSCDALSFPIDLCHGWSSCSLYVSFEGLPDALVTWWAGGGAVPSAPRGLSVPTVASTTSSLEEEEEEEAAVSLSSSTVVVLPETSAGSRATIQSHIIAQRRGYTLAMLLLRSVLFFVTIQRLIVFFGALQWSCATPEQLAIACSFASLLVYLNPLYALNVFSSSSSSLRWYAPWSSASPVLSFIDVHFSYIFFAQVTLLVVYLSLCTLPWGVKEEQWKEKKEKIKKKKAPPITRTPRRGGERGSGLQKRVGHWKAYWCQSAQPFFPPPWLSLLYAVLVGIISVLVVVRGVMLDRSPSYWLLPIPNPTSSPRSLSVMLVVIQLCIAIVCIGCMVVSFVLPAFFSYTQLHSRWLAVRALERFYLPLVLVVLGELIAYRVYYPIVFPSLFPSASSPQQCLNSVSAVWVGSGVVFLMGFVYTARPSCIAASPIPISPADARWKTMRWTKEWIVPLARRGGQQYIFFSEREERAFKALQPVWEMDHHRRSSSAVASDVTPPPVVPPPSSSSRRRRRGGEGGRSQDDDVPLRCAASAKGRPSCAMGGGVPTPGPTGVWSVYLKPKEKESETPSQQRGPSPLSPFSSVRLPVSVATPPRHPRRDPPRPKSPPAMGWRDLRWRSGKAEETASWPSAVPAAFLVHLTPRSTAHRCDDLLGGLREDGRTSGHFGLRDRPEVLLASYAISTAHAGPPPPFPPSPCGGTMAGPLAGWPDAAVGVDPSGPRRAPPLLVEEEEAALKAYLQQAVAPPHTAGTTMSKMAPSASRPPSSPSGSSSPPVVWQPPLFALRIPDTPWCTARTSTETESQGDEEEVEEMNVCTEENADATSTTTPYTSQRRKKIQKKKYRQEEAPGCSGPPPSSSSFSFGPFFSFGGEQERHTSHRASRCVAAATAYVSRGMREVVLGFLEAMVRVLRAMRWISGGDGWMMTRAPSERRSRKKRKSEETNGPHCTLGQARMADGSAWESHASHPPFSHTTRDTLSPPPPPPPPSFLPRRAPDAEWPHAGAPSRERGTTPILPGPMCQRCGIPLPRYASPTRTSTVWCGKGAPSPSPSAHTAASQRRRRRSRRGSRHSVDIKEAYCRRCRGTIQREAFECSRFPHFFVLETAIDCCNLSLEVYKELKPVTAEDVAQMERLHPQMSTASLLRLDPPCIWHPPPSPPVSPRSTSLLHRTWDWSKRTWQSLHLGPHTRDPSPPPPPPHHRTASASFPPSRDDSEAERRRRSGGEEVAPVEAVEREMPGRHPTTTTMTDSDRRTISPRSARSAPLSAFETRETPTRNHLAAEASKAKKKRWPQTERREEEESEEGGPPLPLAIPPEALVEPPYGWMNVAQFGYRLCCVKIIKKVQFLLAVLDTNLPIHAGKPPRIAIAFRGTSRMSNVKKDTAIWNVPWAEARPRERSDRTHAGSAARNKGVSTSPSPAAAAAAPGEPPRPSSPLCPSLSFTSLSSNSDESTDESTEEEESGGGSEREGSTTRKEAKKALKRKKWRRMKELEKVYAQGGTVPMVHAGFLSLWESLRSDVRKKLRLVEREMDAVMKGRKEAEKYAPPYSSSSSELEVVLTGHSLGGALAVLCAYHLSRWFRWRGGKTPRLVVYTFGQPSMGNTAFEKNYNHYVRHSYQVTNESDLVSAACGGFTGGTKVQVDRYGNYIVNPSQAERVLEPLKGKGLSVVHHLLNNYAVSLNAIADGSGGECKVRVNKPYQKKQELNSLSVLWDDT